MNSRLRVIVVLLVIELAIIGGMVRAIQGDRSGDGASARVEAQAAGGPHLIEGGPHQTFAAGAHPALTVDIGYADLTILTRSEPQIDVAVSKSSDFGYLRAKAPITAMQAGGTVRIGTRDDGGISMGDNRMVTVLVPPDTRVNVISAGDINTTGLRAEASLSSAGSGTITVSDYDAPALHAETSNGRISLHQIATTRLEATTSNGRIEGSGMRVRDGSVESSNGRVTLGFAPGADTLVSAKTSNGLIRVIGIAPTIAPPAAPGASGNADNSDDTDVSRTVRIGAGTGRLDVHTSNGDISLSQGA